MSIYHTGRYGKTATIGQRPSTFVYYSPHFPLAPNFIRKTVYFWKIDFRGIPFITRSQKWKVGTYVNDLRLKVDGKLNRIGRSWKMWTNIEETSRSFDLKLFVFQIVQLIYDCPILVVWIVQFTFALKFCTWSFAL